MYFGYRKGILCGFENSTEECSIKEGCSFSNFVSDINKNLYIMDK